MLQGGDLWPQDVKLGTAAQVCPDAGHVGQNGAPIHDSITTGGRQHARQDGDGCGLPCPIVACTRVTACEACYDGDYTFRAGSIGEDFDSSFLYPGMLMQLPGGISSVDHIKGVTL